MVLPIFGTVLRTQQTLIAHMKWSFLLPVQAGCGILERAEKNPKCGNHMAGSQRKREGLKMRKLIAVLTALVMMLSAAGGLGEAGAGTVQENAELFEAILNPFGAADAEKR